jgi:hypothetical protein
MRKATVSFLKSVCPPHGTNPSSSVRIFMKFDIWVFFRKFVKNIHVSLKLGENNDYFTWRIVRIVNHTSLSSS